MKQKKPYKQCSREFKLEAIRLADVRDKTASQVARELGIRVNQLWKWRQKPVNRGQTPLKEPAIQRVN